MQVFTINFLLNTGPSAKSVILLSVIANLQYNAMILCFSFSLVQ